MGWCIGGCVGDLVALSLGTRPALVVVAHFLINRNCYAWPVLGLCVGWYVGELVVLLVRVLYLTVFAFACCIDLCCVLN